MSILGKSLSCPRQAPYHLALLAYLGTFVGCGMETPPRRRAPATPSAQANEYAAGQALPESLPGSYIVAFRPNPETQGGPGLGFASFAAEHQAHFTGIAASFLSDPRVQDIRFLAAVDLRSDGAGVATAGATFASPYLQQLGGGNLAGAALIASLAQVEFASPDDATATLAEWTAGGGIWFAEPNYVSRLSQETKVAARVRARRTTLVDPGNVFKSYGTNYGSLNTWWFNAIKLPAAFQAIANRDTSQPGVPSESDITTNRPLVAVLDSGVDYEHPALKSHIWQNSDQNAANCTGDLHGCNTTEAKRGSLGNGDVWPFGITGPNMPCADIDPNCSHGTHVAGLIAADGTWSDITGSTAAGVCPVCQIMIVKIVSQVGKESGILDSSIIAAFKYVTLFRHEGSPAVRVVNASFGKFVRSRSVGLLVRLMRDRNSTLLVAAAGNEDTLTQEYPAAFSDAIAVAAVDSRLHKDGFSNFGRWVGVSAPGDEIASTVPGAAVEAKSGTSMASPIVAGLAGLMLARYPNLSFEELRDGVLQSADPSFYRAEFEDGYNYKHYYPKITQQSIRQPLLGYGMLNASAAINRTPSQGLPLFTNLDRVKPGCSVVAAERGSSKPWAWLYTFGCICLPVGCVMYEQSRRQSLQLKRRILR